MPLLYAIPALPVSDTGTRLAFYRDILGFTVLHETKGFAIVQRDSVVLHLWQASDEGWRAQALGNLVVSGAESFLAGTGSCRIAVQEIDALYRELAPYGIAHPNAPLTDQPWGTREFGVLDSDNNLITFFEPLSLPGRG